MRLPAQAPRFAWCLMLHHAAVAVELAESMLTQAWGSLHSEHPFTLLRARWATQTTQCSMCMRHSGLPSSDLPIHSNGGKMRTLASVQLH